jgi:hypothetical protein
MGTKVDIHDATADKSRWPPGAMPRLILPLYYADCDQLQEGFPKAMDAIADLLREPVPPFKWVSRSGTMVRSEPRGALRRTYKMTTADVSIFLIDDDPCLMA